MRQSNRPKPKKKPKTKPTKAITKNQAVSRHISFYLTPTAYRPQHLLISEASDTLLQYLKS
jgi:hypothetical protein